MDNRTETNGYNNQQVEYNNQQINPTDFLLFQQKRMMTFLFKTFLIELEEMMNEHLISEEYFRKQRKTILDDANNSFREFGEYLDKFDIKYKQ